jgi:hypothetical protein
VGSNDLGRRAQKEQSEKVWREEFKCCAQRSYMYLLCGDGGLVPVSRFGLGRYYGRSLVGWQAGRVIVIEDDLIF